MTKPMFRIEQLISALLKGSPDDPVYLRVGSSKYGIKSINDGSIRVTSDGSTQDAAQVVKTLRRYVASTPKGDKTGISWRIVGVGGGTAIKSVSHDGSQIVVTTLANEGKAAEESEIFEAPKAKKKVKKELTYEQKHSAAVSKKISDIMNDYERTGRIGRSKPASRAAALKQAVAVAYSMVNQSYRQSGKRIPSRTKRSEGEQSRPFNAPMGYAPDGPRPFYGNRRKLVRDRWGNLRFIRRRKDGTYMDNVDFGRSLKADRRRQAKTWAPLGFRDQGDGSLDLLTSLMGAEGNDWGEFDDYDVSIPANPTENQNDLLEAFATYSYYGESHDKILMRGLEIVEEPDFRKLLAVCKKNDGIIDSSHPAEAYIIAIECYDALRSDTMGAEGTDETEYPQEFLDEFYDFDSNPTADTQDEETIALAYATWLYNKENQEYPEIWLVNSSSEGIWEEAQAFRDQSDARRRFDEIVVQMGGDPSDAQTGLVLPHAGRIDWVEDEYGFNRVVMYQVELR